MSLLKNAYVAGHNGGMDEVELQDRFVESVDKILAERGMTRNDLAQIMGVQRQVITTYLNKHACPGLPMIAKFCKALNVDIVDLFENRQALTPV